MRYALLLPALFCFLPHATAAPVTRTSGYVTAALGLQQQWLGTLRHLTEVLRGVKDKESADAAAPALRAAVEQMQALQREAEGFAAPSAAEEAAYKQVSDTAEVRNTVNAFTEALKAVAEAGVYGSDALSAELAKLFGKLP